MCSGVLIVKEAGGKISQPDGKDWTIKNSDILASNTLIHDQIIKNLKIC